MSQSKIQTALMNWLQSATTVPIIGLNMNEDPNQFDSNVYIEPFLIPAGSESLGKATGDVDDFRGVFQMNIRQKSGTGNLDTQNTIDEIFAAGPYGTELVEAGQIIELLERSAESDTTDDGESGWFTTPASIVYSSYIPRV